MNLRILLFQQMGTGLKLLVEIKRLDRQYQSADSKKMLYSVYLSRYGV